ncbi:retrovirus-related pol polyprotein from transposon TNT 1-94 [Tanacetum coccineum]
MSTANQQTLVESGTEGRPLILEKGSYVPWANRFLRFFDIKREEGELIRNSIDNGMPNDIYNSGDACKDAQDMWKRIKRLMHGTNISKQERHSRLMNEFDKFVTEDGESLTSVNARFSTLINNMDQNEFKPKEISINTKLLNSLQPGWSKYVTLTPSKEKMGARNHDPLSLVANSYASPLYSHASPLYSCSPQPYYVTHPSFVIDYDDDYQGEIQGDTQEYKLSTTMIKNQAVIQDGRVDSQSKNVGYAENDVASRKDEAGVNLDAEENDFMLMNEYGDDQLEELNASLSVSVEQQTIEKLKNEKDEIRDQFLEARYESMNIKNETESFKKAFKVRDDKYLDDIVTLEKFIGTVRFSNDHFAAIIRYGDYVQGNLTICHVYYVEGLGHNIFSVRQFYDRDLEVAFRSNTCYMRNLEGEVLLTGSRDSNLYTIDNSVMATSSPVCLMSKDTLTKSLLWHRRLSHMNFGTINHFTNQNLVDGLLKFKYDKDHLCPVYQQGKSKKAILKPNWVYFLHTKDVAPEMIIKFITQIQQNMRVQILKSTVRKAKEKSRQLACLGIMEMEPDIENMMLNEYLDYEAEKERRSGENVRSNISPTRIGAENLRRIMGQEKDVDLEKEEAQVEDDDYGNIYDIWDITVEDVEWIRQFLTPNVPDEIDEVPRNTPLDHRNPFTPTTLMNVYIWLWRNLVVLVATYLITRVSLQRGWNSRSPRLALCGKVVVVMQQVMPYTGDDELLESWMLLEEADLEHSLERAISSSYQANPRE